MEYYFKKKLASPNKNQKAPKKSRINSKAKGSRGERMLRDCFRSHGYASRRTQQYAGNTGDASDVVVEEFPWLHIEVKNTEAKDFLKWLDQAENDAAFYDKVPLVCHKRNGRDWIAMMPLHDLIRILGFYNPNPESASPRA